MASIAERHDGEGRSLRSLIYDPQIRGYFFQAVAVIVLGFLIYEIYYNVVANLQRSNLTAGFGFLNGRAGFDIGQTLIDFNSDSSYLRALQAGFANTLLVAVCGIVTASLIGLLVGIGRLSSNWLIARLSTIYVEVFRNIPPLLVVFFWYSGVLSILPAQVSDSIAMPFSTYLNNRGFYFPKPIFENGFGMVMVAFVIALIGAFAFARWARIQQMATGRQYPVFLIDFLILIGLPLVLFIAVGSPLSFDYPVVDKFNIKGGSDLVPEFVSLYLALSFYTASFIAEIVRAGIRGVASGQTEAARALGLRHGLTTRLVILPQALRIIIPPLTSQYLNLTKNSSLAIAVGYADLVSVGGTILNQTSHSIEIIGIWMAVYVSISLVTSLIMNWFNAKMALVER